jgi:HD-GYP domain-containing protein (c-di-GMP phosphodiesterase class II)
MDALKLAYPVYTVENQLLLPAGAMLSQEILEELISSPAAGSNQTYSLLGHGTVKHDMLRLIRKPPYDSILSDREQTDEILSIMETIRLALPVLETLNYFKTYDYHTYCHNLMVFALSTLIARDLIPDYADWIRGVSIGPTHDIGKICVPPHILKKQTPLTRTERSILDHHAAAGYVLLAYYHSDLNNLAAVVARDHHERRDGSGKPRGIHLMDFMVEIIVVCDVYDALLSPRPYRPASYDNRTALEEITRMAEMKKIGWEVVKALVARNRKGKPRHDETDISDEKRGTPPPVNCHGLLAEDDES